MAAMADSVPWLELDRITVGYGRRAVAENLTLKLDAGRIGCLLGPSGCGKTTVLRAIAGFEPVRSGAIRLGGAIVSSSQQQVAPESRRIGMVFQDHALFPHLTIAANVAFGLRGRADTIERTQQMLETVGLAHAAERFPHELSGG